MRLYSTNKKSPEVSFKEALFTALPDDNGLYLPTKIPQLEPAFFTAIGDLNLQEIAFRVSNLLIGDEVPEPALTDIIEEAINFDAPLISLTDRLNILELYHGPTLAFKDFGGRFMSRMMSHFLEQEDKEITILVATSGDTGSAVANGFLGVPGIKVVILYPSGKVSEFQEKQFTTLGKNVVALELDGTFDDCQKLVKQAFLDPQLNAKINLTSANSINIGRLIPQSFYYFYAYAKASQSKKPVVFSVPSGNFGNLCGGILAQRMGMPVQKFLAATNVNDVVPEYLLSGNFKPRPSEHTISNAMDVGNPSNFARILNLYHNDWDLLKQELVGYRFDDTQTSKAVLEVSGTYNYTLDPHSAIGYLALKDFLEKNNSGSVGVALSTAHPSKFSEVVENIIGSKVIIPERLRHVLAKNKVSIRIPNDYDKLKEFILLA